ncbi:MAG: SDR family oxidoreductase [Thermomicrobiales bacterium]|nr:SDR family oxidoreductase [Thermomicrobiales bacterium]
MTTPLTLGDRFDDRVALITGSSRNLGAAIARRFAAQGAIVAIHYQQDEIEARAVVETIVQTRGQAAAFQADLSDGADARNLGETVLERFGRIDILINAVGPYADTPFASLAEPDWDRVMDANVKAPYLLTQIVAPGMRERGWGRIVNISAGSAYIRAHSVYGLAKDAVRHLTESLAVELAPQITVNAIAPGQIEDTPAIDIIAPGYKDALREGTPLRRLVTWDELSQLAVLLCSEPFAMMTGQTLVMDGGWSLPVGRATPVIGKAV